MFIVHYSLRTLLKFQFGVTVLLVLSSIFINGQPIDEAAVQSADDQQSEVSGKSLLDSAGIYDLEPAASSVSHLENKIVKLLGKCQKKGGCGAGYTGTLPLAYPGIGYGYGLGMPYNGLYSGLGTTGLYGGTTGLYGGSTGLYGGSTGLYGGGLGGLGGYGLGGLGGYSGLGSLYGSGIYGSGLYGSGLSSYGISPYGGLGYPSIPSYGYGLGGLRSLDGSASSVDHSGTSEYAAAPADSY